MTALLLYFTTALIGGLWLKAQINAARQEFSRAILRQQWIVATGVYFAVVVGVTLTAGASGWLGDFNRVPPPMVIFFFALWAIAIYTAFSAFGSALVKHTPLYQLVGFHAFRILAELILWSAYNDGLAPRALTFHGYQFDIITGLTALPLAYWVHRHPNTRLIKYWNAMGFAFLLAIAYIAMASMPTPFRVFMEEPSNIWVTRLPYTLLPGVLVVAAIAGHLVIFRKLKSSRA